MLIRGLPPDSATRQAMNGGEPLWSRTDYILADLIDSSNATAWLVANKDQPVSKRTPFPEPYGRPGMGGRKRNKITADDLRAFQERTKRG